MNVKEGKFILRWGKFEQNWESCCDKWFVLWLCEVVMVEQEYRETQTTNRGFGA